MMITPQEEKKLLALLGSVNFFGGIIFGYSSGIIAYVIPAMISSDFPELGDFSLEQGIVTCSLLIGCLIGSIFSPTFCELVRKKKVIFGIGFLTAVATLLTAVSFWLELFVVTRQILGLAVGVASVVCPTYVSELAPPRYSGALGGFFQVSITLGILISYFTGLLFANVNYGWNIMLVLGIIPGIFLAIVSFFIPDAPSDNKPINHDAIEKYQEAKTTGFAVYLLLIKKYPGALFLGIVLAVALQLTGINAVFYYAPDIFVDAGFNTRQSQYATFGIGFCNFISTFVALALVDRIGRKPLVLSGLITMTAASIILGFIFQFSSNPTVSGWTSLVLIVIYILGFEAGIGSLFWPLLSEIFPEEAIQGGASLMNSLQWTFNILLTLFFPSIASFSAALAFWMFGVIGIFCVVILFLKLKETKKFKAVMPNDEFENVKHSRIHPDEHVIPSDSDSSHFFD